MIPNVGLQRPLVAQQVRTFAFAVTTNPLPIDPHSDKTKLITSFVIANPSTGASVFIGNAGVSAASGLEIPAGTAPMFSVDNQGRQLYELQQLLLSINTGLKCAHVPLEGLPFVVWDLSTLFLVAAANTTVSIGVFPTMYL